MRVVLYEWCCSGGLRGPDARRLTAAASSPAEAVPAMMAEAAAMLAALAEDAARDRSLDVTLLVDEDPSVRLAADRRMERVGHHCRVRPVPAAAELDALVDEAAGADWTLVVAPETDGLLAERVEAVRRAGGRPAACGARFIHVAGDKQSTATALAAAGVPVPAGRLLDAGDPLPDGFHLPAVCKARDGVGCDGLEIVRSRDEAASPRAARRRVEAFAPGVPVGVSCLCGPAGVLTLPPVRQRFSPGSRPAYLGGTVVDSAAWRPRAESLAKRAIAAVARSAGGATLAAAAAGWVGVDMVLGSDDDGRGDRVLEVNPRLTTSFVGLAARQTGSLLRLLLDVAAGDAGRFQPAAGRTVEFDAEGTVRCGDG